MTRFVRALALLAAVAAPAGGLGAQADTTAVAGARYRAGSLQQWLWGGNYRTLWATPLRVPILDPDTFAGGLTPLRAGGDFASNTLHLRGRDGRRYVFRSVDKNVGKGLGPEFEGTLVEWVVQDQVSASHPVAPLLAAPLLEAAGVLHATPRLAVMADRASLGQHRARFAGMLGMIEERPDENRPGDDGDEDADAAGDGEQGGDEEDDADAAGDTIAGPPFAGADVVKGTEKFLDDLEDDPENRVDARAYLAARLMDILMGDWDRHDDQWRWAGYDRGGLRWWLPIPRDRDNAFVMHEGVLMALARSMGFKRMVRFDPEYPALSGLTVQSEPLDRRLLSELPRAAWDSVARAVQARVTDPAIAYAVVGLPDAYRSWGEWTSATLRARRDALHHTAMQWYARMATDVDVHATDADETLVVERIPGGADVRITARVDGREMTTFQRRFLSGETEEVRIHLQGGDDRAVVRGPGGDLGIRVVGGGGDDVLADSSAGGAVAFYDHRGDNQFVRGRGTRVDTRAWEQPEDSTSITGSRMYRDWGSTSSLFSPWADWRRGAGLVVGGGPSGTRWGFRRQPYALSHSLHVGFAPVERRWLAKYSLAVHPENTARYWTLDALWSGMEYLRFPGYGNDLPRVEPRSLNEVWMTRIRVEPAFNQPFMAGDGEWSLGAVFQLTNPNGTAGGPLETLRPLGSRGSFGQLGLRSRAEIDRRDDGAFPRSGWRLEGGAAAWAPALDVEEPFAHVELEANAYLSPFGGGPVLALRAGGRHVWGDFPFFEAAFLGGGGTLRGFAGQRFAGDAAAYGGAELRQPLFRLNVGVRGTLGVLALADVGQVWFDGWSAGDWHTAVGGGVFFLALGQSFTVAVANGEQTKVHFTLGMPF
ncbi:MAG TPA: BamA/TamA family outer membrane protein [Longimicrobium sp.]|nr:BamA/TamA family outer membrane protein [Longimicrobium sp.]